MLSDGCYAQFPVIILPPISCRLAGVRLAVIDSDFHRGDETVLNLATVCHMVKTVLAGVNIVERGLFIYSSDRIIPIKPSLYRVYVRSFLPYPRREVLCWFKIISLTSCWYLKENFNRTDRLGEFKLRWPAFLLHIGSKARPIEP